MKIFLLSIALILMASTTAYAERCPDSTYFCLNPEGKEFPGGTVGPITMFHNVAEGRCVASPVSRYDGCEQVTRHCNQRFPGICHGDCLVGDAVSRDVEASCEGSFIIAPSSSVPIHPEVGEY